LVDAKGLAFAIDLVEPLGPETLIHGRLPCGQLLTLRRPGGPPETGVLNITLPDAALHFFNAATGERVAR